MDLSKNAQRFTGKDYVQVYDQHRPVPPVDLIMQALIYLGREPELVLDLGCGTGISTRIWQNHCGKIIGLEPSEAMIAIAESRKLGDKTHFIQAFAHDIPLKDSSVDIVCCSQSFHWMEPVSTLKEVSRVLKSGGVFIVYDCSWPPSFDLELEKAYVRLFKQVSQITQTLNQAPAHYFKKEDHRKNIEDSRCFSFVKEAYFHKAEQGGVEQFLGIALSQGGLETLLKLGFTEEKIGLTTFKAKVMEKKDQLAPRLHFHYKAIYSVK